MFAISQNNPRPSKILEALVEMDRLTYADNSREIQQTETELDGMIEELDADEFDLQGLAELKTLLARNMEKGFATPLFTDLQNNSAH